MDKKALFQKSEACDMKMPHTDEHRCCVICLGETQNVFRCRICQGFTPKAHADRAMRLKAAMWENVFSSSAEQGASTPVLVSGKRRSAFMSSEHASRAPSVISMPTASVSVLDIGSKDQLSELKRSVSEPPTKRPKKHKEHKSGSDKNNK